MNSIPFYYEFLNEAVDKNKIYFCLNNNNIETVTSDNAQNLNKSLDNYILKNFFEDVVIIQDLDFDEIENLEFPKNSVVYSFKPAGVYQPVNNEDRKKVHAMFDSLHSNKNITAYMNKNITSSKVKTQKMFNGEYYFPNAVYKKEDVADQIGFPVVAKPDSGHSGEGIQKFNNQKELDKFYEENPDTVHDLYCEFVDFEREYRALFCENDIFYLGERIPKIEVNIDINNKKSTDQMAFVYVAQDLKKFPYLKELLKINKDVYEKVGMKIYSIDFFLTKKKELTLIEINSQTGLDPYRLLHLYKHLYKKHFNTDLPSNKNILFKKLIDIFLNNEYKHFQKEIDKALTPVNYKDVKIDNQLLKEVSKMPEDKIK